LDSSPCSIWISLVSDYPKMNVDAAFKSPDLPIGIGFVLRYTNATFLYAEQESSHADSAAEADMPAKEGSSNV
ncbi:hypothetical protein FRX31_023106, partial [Thalictrum thalictroides]